MLADEALRVGGVHPERHGSTSPATQVTAFSTISRVPPVPSSRAGTASGMVAMWTPCPIGKW